MHSLNISIKGVSYYFLSKIAVTRELVLLKLSFRLKDFSFTKIYLKNMKKIPKIFVKCNLTLNNKFLWKKKNNENSGNNSLERISWLIDALMGQNNYCIKRQQVSLVYQKIEPQHRKTYKVNKNVNASFVQIVNLNSFYKLSKLF